MGPVNILVVDDEPSVLNLVSQVLCRDGYTAHCASDGRAALEILQQHHFDLIVSDVVMPGMSGPQLLAEVAKLSPHMPALLISGGIGNEKLPANANLLRKPFTIGDLTRRVSETLAGSERRPLSDRLPPQPAS